MILSSIVLATLIGGLLSVLIAASLKVPVLGLYGGQDQGIPVDTVEQMRKAVPAGLCDFQIYPNAPHGFNADYRPSYRAAEAREAWGRMLDWFRSHGVR